MSKRNHLWTALMVGAVGACGGSTDGGSSPGGNIALSSIPGLYAAAYCTALQSCLGQLYTIYMGGTDCKAQMTQRIDNSDFAQYQAKIDAGKMKYDGARAQACVDAIAARTCDTLNVRPIPECEAALDGTVALGGSCDLDGECTGAAFCQSASGKCPGTCTALLAAGQPCTKDDVCASGLQCSTITTKCVQPAPAGQACEGPDQPPCASGLLCMGKDVTTAGTCKTPAQVFTGAAGATCDVKAQLCVVGQSCAAAAISGNTITGTCVATGGYAAGAACKPSVPEACATGYFCKTAVLTPFDGTCTALPQKGEDCGKPVLGAVCAPNLVCVGAKCEDLVANGVSCTADAKCYSEHCVSGGCQAKVPCQ